MALALRMLFSIKLELIRLTKMVMVLLMNIKGRRSQLSSVTVVQRELKKVLRQQHYMRTA